MLSPFIINLKAQKGGSTVSKSEPDKKAWATLTLKSVESLKNKKLILKNMPKISKNGRLLFALRHSLKAEFLSVHLSY